jgi:hypothetical protein
MPQQYGILQNKQSLSTHQSPQMLQVPEPDQDLVDVGTSSEDDDPNEETIMSGKSLKSSKSAPKHTR